MKAEVRLLVVIACLLLVIVGLMARIQYEKWELKQKEEYSKEWKRKMDSVERVNNYMYELKLKELNK